MFDLPTLTQQNMRDYRQFRKYLIKSGFLMLQESVYCKLVPNSNAGDALVANLRKNKLEDGLFESLVNSIGCKTYFVLSMHEYRLKALHFNSQIDKNGLKNFADSFRNFETKYIDEKTYQNFGRFLFHSTLIFNRILTILTAFESYSFSGSFSIYNFSSEVT